MVEKKLEVQIIGKDKLTPVVKKAEGATSRFGKALKIAGLIGKFALLGIAAAAAVVVAGLTATVFWLKGALSKYQEYMKGLVKVQRVTGLSAKATSILVAQWRLSGVAADKAGTAMGILSTKVYDAYQAWVKNTKAARDAAKAGKDFQPTLSTQQKLFASLGIRVHDAAGKMVEVSAILPTLRRRLMELDSTTERVALARKLMGRGAQELLPWLMKTAAQIKEMNKFISDAGGIFGGKTIKTFKEFVQLQRRTSFAWDMFKINAAAALVPLANKWLPYAVAWLGRASHWMSRFRALAEKKGLEKALKEMAPWVLTVRDRLLGIYNKLATIYTWLQKNWHDISHLFGLIFAPITVGSSLLSDVLRKLGILRGQKPITVPIMYRINTIGNPPVIPSHAAGGIVTRPQLALVGEAGPEAIIPLNRPGRAAQVMGQAGLGAPIIIHNHFEGGILGTQDELAEKMAAANMRAITKLQRRMARGA